MRVSEIARRCGLACLLGPMAAVALFALSGGCKSEPAADPGPKLAAANSEGNATPGHGSAEDRSGRAGDREAGDREAAAEPLANPNDPERADKLADLDAMCAALDRDYDDGTLTDYYQDVKPRTEWGKAQRKAGDASIQPGRLLEKAVAELDPGATDPSLEHCRKLLDYLDDVE